MARKLNPKLVRQNDTATQVLSRRPAAPAPTLYLMQLRAQTLKIAPPRRLRLEVNAENGVETPEPVKIVWADKKEG